MTTTKLDFENVIGRILEQNLRMRADEKYLFFTDSNSRWEENFDTMVERRKFLHSFYAAFDCWSEKYPNRLCDKYQSTERHGAEPGPNVWRLALGKESYAKMVRMDYFWRLKEGAELSETEWREVHELIEARTDQVVDCVIAFPWFSTTHTRFRSLLNHYGCRYVSMPMLTARVMGGPMLADWNEVAATTEGVFRILRETRRLRMICPAGSKLTMEVGGEELIHKDAGDFGEAGAVGNLPAGEAYLVPRAGTAKGQVAFTSAPEMPSIATTVALIEDGRIAGFESETEYATILEQKFLRDFEMRNLAELGIGTNPLARDVSSMIEGEKIQGTVHIALGDDKAMGGDVEATEHLDHIIKQPTLVAERHDGEECVIVEEGRLLPVGTL